MAKFYHNLVSTLSPHANKKPKRKRRAWKNLSHEKCHRWREMCVNEWTHPRFMDRILAWLGKLSCQQNGTRWHYTTLHGSTASYGEGTQTRTFENHANLLAYLPNWPLYTPENGFLSAIKHKCAPFLGFGQVYSALTLWKKTQNGLLLKHGYVYCRLSNYVRGIRISSIKSSTLFLSLT